MAKEKKDLATPGSSNVPAVGAPLGRGHEEAIAQEDIIIPRAKLLQALSPEVQDDGMKQGLIINSLTKEELPDVFVPVFKTTNWARFNPRKKDDPNFNKAFEPAAVIWKSADPKDPRVIEEAVFGPNGEVPIATKFLNFFCHFPGMNMPLVLSFSKSSFRAGKTLLSLTRFSGGDMFARQYRLKAKQKDNDGIKYFVFEVSLAGNTPDDAFKISESWYNSFKDLVPKMKVHEEDQPPEEEA